MIDGLTPTGLLLLVALAAFLHGLQALFLALGTFRRALHQFATDQFEDHLLRAVSLAEAELHDAGVSAVALAEARAERIEQLLYRGRSPEERSCLAPCMKR